jgi:hypothetical protein
MRYENLLPIFAAFLISCNPLIAQRLTQNEQYYKWFDALVGIENTGLYEGIFYKEAYRTINENTQFFLSPGFHSGTVVYNSQVYVELRLKYNVYADQLLVKVQDRLGGNTLQLFREKVSEFTIDGHLFTRIPEGNAASVVPGFYEISVQTPSFRLLTRHSKKLFDRKDRSSLYYEFLDIKKAYLLHYHGSYHPINNKRDVTEIFPRLEKQINDYYNRARVLRRTDPHQFTLGLMQRIGSLLPQPNSTAI